MTTDLAGVTCRSEEEEDLLSKLPNELLLSILEKLELRDAVRVGVLSQRWGRLPHQLPKLALDVNDFLPVDEEHNYYEDEGGDELELQADDTLAKASDAMLEAMAALLASRRGGEAGCTLAVGFLLRHNFMSIGRLLEYAMASGKAHTLELDISSTFSLTDDDGDMGHSINIQLAYGRRFRTLFDGCQAAFSRGLTRLTMGHMQLLRRDLDDILACCTRLEMISLYACDAGGRVPWCVRHARLAELSITYCCFGCIDLAWLPRLQRFTCRFWPCTPIASFGHVPRLATVTLSQVQMIGEPTLRLSEVLANTAVTDLGLNFRGHDIWVKPEGPKRLVNLFRNLKRIKIRNLNEDCGLSWINFQLQSSPCLEELHLLDHECTMQYDGDENKRSLFAINMVHVPWEVLPTGFKHYTLARVTILGFDNNNARGERVVAFIRHLVETAVNLEEIRMLKNKPCKECGAAETMGFPRTGQDRDSLRQRIFGGEPVAFKICI